MTSENIPELFVGVICVAFAGWEVWQGIGPSHPNGFCWGERGESAPFSRFSHLVWGLIAGVMGFGLMTKVFNYPFRLPPHSIPIAALLLTIGVVYDNYGAKRLRTILHRRNSRKTADKGQTDKSV